MLVTQKRELPRSVAETRAYKLFWVKHIDLASLYNTVCAQPLKITYLKKDSIET